MSVRSRFVGRESITRYSLFQSILLTGPLFILLGVFYLYPLVTLFPESILKNGHITWEHYRHFFREPLYTYILLRTVRVAVVVTVICFLLGYPIAYFLAGLKSQKTANLMMICVLLPFFTSILVRSYAWIVLLQTKGILNRFLISIGLIERPLNLLYTEFAVLLGMVHILLPFMILPVYSVLKNIDRNLLRAARNLGANAVKAFALVTFPLSLPGVGAGVMFVFILSLGFYITPALLGGPKTLMITTLIDQQINRLINWDFAGAIVVVLLVTTILMILIFDKIVGLDKIYRD
ncbi:MAG: ABC transporter permease [Deltaproteobacteria bacterium]|nr:ABC transporter permease [Deltaproteobacteria bacterium]MBW2121328.1 ABC transporter permease [Deltaproteobacteria bacterium]